MRRRMFLLLAPLVIAMFAWLGYARWQHHQKLTHHPLELLMEADKDDAIAEFYAVEEAMGDSAFRSFQSIALADPQNDLQVLELLCDHAAAYPLGSPSPEEFKQKAELLNTFPLDTTWVTTVNGYPVRLNNKENSTAILKLNKLVAGSGK